MGFPVAVLTGAAVRALPYEKLARELKKFLSLEALASVYATSRGMEVGFMDRKTLVEFAERAPEEWGLESGDISTTVVLTPTSGTGHVNVGDGVILPILQKYGQVASYKQGVYPGTKILNGQRLFQMDLKAEPPSSLSLGSVSFRVAYKGQIKRCYRCRQTGHEAKNCDGVSKPQCFNCGSGEHLVSACESPRKCAICAGNHLYKFCPKSYAGRVANADEGQWAKFNPDQVTQSEFENVDDGKDSQTHLEGVMTDEQLRKVLEEEVLLGEDQAERRDLADLLLGSCREEGQLVSTEGEHLTQLPLGGLQAVVDDQSIGKEKNMEKKAESEQSSTVKTRSGTGSLKSSVASKGSSPSSVTANRGGSIGGRGGRGINSGRGGKSRGKK